MKKGLLYVFTGEGKGKTSAALGVAVRAVCAGLKVSWIAWYKEEQWDISEKHLREKLGLEMYFLGQGFYIKNSNYKIRDTKQDKDSKKNTPTKVAPLKGGGIVVDHETQTNHKIAAEQALTKLQDLLACSEYAVIICDEINNAMADGLLEVVQVLEVLNKRGKTHIVLTGRNVPDLIAEKADLITEMKKIKHPYDSGIKAVKGLDF